MHCTWDYIIYILISIFFFLASVEYDKIIA